MSVRSDAALLRRFRAGDEAAFAALHARYADGIRSYAAYMLRGSAHDPEDAAQDVFLRAYQALRRDDRDVDVRPWLFRVAHNRCIDALRRPLTDDLDAEETAAGGAADPASAIEQREAMRALLKDIGALTDGQRSALLLRELGGLSHEAVAEALGISTTSSRMLVHRARVALTDAAEARDTTCREVRDRLVAASDAGTRPARRERRHLAGCAECRAFRRAHAGVERELSLLVPFAGGSTGLAALLKVFGGAGASGGAVAASTTAGAGAGAGGLAAKLTVGACCALLAGGGAAVGVKEATEHHHQQRPRTAERHATTPKPKPAPVATTPAPTVTHTAVAQAAKRAVAKPSTPARTTTPAAPPAQTVSTSPTAQPPAHEDPKRSVDLADLSGQDATPAPRQTTTIDLAALGG